jgi:hypothetical protein
MSSLLGITYGGSKLVNEGHAWRQPLESLASVTARKFGPAGLAALEINPWLKKAKISPELYMEEFGRTGKFFLKTLDGTIVWEKATGREDIRINNQLVFKADPFFIPRSYKVAGGIAAAIFGVGIILMWRS